MDGRATIVRRTECGLTLLELLVVISILALLVTVAVFNAPPPRSSARDEAERFAARLTVARQDAVLEGAVMSVEMTPRSYLVARYANGEWRVDENAGRFGERSLARGVTAALTLEDAALANKPGDRRGMRADNPQRIVLDPIGIAPKFSVEFVDSRSRWLVRGGEGQKFEVIANGRR